MDELELLTSEEVLAELKISRSTLDRLLATGQIQAQRVTEKGALRFLRRDVRSVLVPRAIPVTRGQLPARGFG